MRFTTLLAGILLATALLNLAPAVEARSEIGDCVTIQYGGVVDSTVCTDRCYYQSDCCSSYSFWCPEDS